MHDDAVPNGSISVLICDDFEPLRILLARVLEDTPGLYVIGEAEDGVQTIAEALRLQPDVVLLDLSMPVKTGFDALPDIKRVAPNAKVIVLSGFDPTTSLSSEVLARGADSYLEKGVHPDRITATIVSVMSRESERQPQAGSPA